MDLSILEDFGFTNAEVKTYLAILKLGETKVGRIIEESGLVSSVVYAAINILVDKGLVSYIKKGSVKYYRAASPKNLLGFIDKKKEQVKKIIPGLSALKTESGEENYIETFEGFSGIRTVLMDLINAAKKDNKESLFFAINIPSRDEKLNEAFEIYDSEAKKNKIRTKGIAYKKHKKYFENRKGIKMRYASSFIPENLSIAGDKTAIICWNEKPLIILITSRQTADMYRELFNQFWSSIR